jgi:hypothetical protein
MGSSTLISDSRNGVDTAGDIRLIARTMSKSSDLSIGTVGESRPTLVLI